MVCAVGSLCVFLAAAFAAGWRAERKRRIEVQGWLDAEQTFAQETLIELAAVRGELDEANHRIRQLEERARTRGLAN